MSLSIHSLFTIKTATKITYIYKIILYICYHENNVPFQLSPQWHNGFVTTHALGHMMYGIIYVYIYI